MDPLRRPPQSTTTFDLIQILVDISKLNSPLTTSNPHEIAIKMCIANFTISRIN